MPRFAQFVAACLIATLVGCIPASNNDGGTDGAGGQTGDVNSNGGTDGSDTGGGSNTNGGDTGGGDTTNTTATTGISGRIAPTESGKHALRSAPNNEQYVVVAQSAETGEIYRGMTGDNGEFEVAIPDSEQGNLFMVAVIGPDAKPLGPVTFGRGGAGDALSGLEVGRNVGLGTIEIPDDLAAGALAPGDDGDLGDNDVAPDVSVRVNEQGAPVGVESFGKGAAAQGAASDNPRQAADADRDGLIDMLDADNDGDGIVDDFDPGSSDLVPGAGAVHLNFFMNLKIAEDRADLYYSGTADQIAAALQTDTIITFEVLTSDADPSITGVRMLDAPAPTYLPMTERMTDSMGGLAFTTWSDTDYAFGASGDRWQAFVRPNAAIDAGDTFTAEVSFSDGATADFSRMINFVFHNIPRLVGHGSAVDSLTEYAGGTVTFDGTHDLVLEFSPPVDETGALLTDLDFHFEIFYNEALGGGQLNQQIDAAATWPTPIPGFDTNGHFYVVPNSALTLSEDNTYTVTLPEGLFVDTVQTTADGPQAVGSYKIDIAAQSNGNNAAVMIIFEKE
jgi:hypothetical protein